MTLDGKAIIVTGSTTGIGAAIARLCAAQGARVLIHGRDQQRANALQQEIGERAAVCIADLLDPQAPQRIVDAALEAFGRIDGLVNNAALILRSNLETTDADTFDRVMAVNARLPLLLIRCAIDHLIARQGSVVGIGSINAYTGEPRQLAYSMSKAAHMTMSRNLANVYGPKRVRFNHFNVGWVLTDNEYALKQREGLPPDWPQQVAGTSNAPSGRMTLPEEIAQHAAFWLSDASRPISGAVIDLEQYPVICRIPLKEGNA